MHHTRSSSSPPRFLAVLLVLATMVLLATVALQAQSTATIKGRVTNDAGEGITDADIVATNVDSGYTNISKSGDGGNFLMTVAPGRYTILVASPAYQQRTEERTILVGQSLDLVFKLSPSSVVAESITVVGDTFVETKTPEVAMNITTQQMKALPQNDRNFLNFAALAPGVQLGNDEQRKEVKAGAQGSQAVNVFIDGVSFKNDVTTGGVVGQDSSRGNPFPQNAVQEFRVVTTNFSAEYQKASSAIITAVTRSGTNSFRGEAFGYYQNKSLVADDPLTGANPEYTRKQYGLDFGGPIVKDKLHFFGSYEGNDQTRDNTVVLGGGFQNDPALRQRLAAYQGTFSSPFNEDLAFGKLSFQPEQRQLMDLSLTYRNETEVSGFGNDVSYDTAEQKNNDTFASTLRHQLTGNDWLNEASLAYQKYEWNPKPLNPNEVGFVYEGLLRIGGRDTEQKIGQSRTSLRDDVTFSTFGGGRHAMKAGGILEQLDYKVTKYFEENPRYFFASDISSTIPYKARWGYGNPDLSADNTQYGIYFQDDWSVNNNLILNLGIRWDYETNMINTDYVTPQEIRDRLGSQFPAKYFTDGTDRSAPTDMFAPRLGFSYDLKGSGKTIVFGGAGRYWDRNLYNNTLDESFRLQHSVGEFFFSADGSPVRGQPAVKWDPKYLTKAGLLEVQATGITGKPEVFLIENNTKVPYSDQWNLGVRQTLGNYLASATYISQRSYNGFTFLWGAGYCCPVFDSHYSNVLISSDDVKTWYDAVVLTLDRPYSNDARYGFNFSYTWSDAEQVGGDLFSLDLPDISYWPKYGTPGTADHRVVANGIFGLPWDVRFSTILQYSSGDKFRIHDFSNGWCSDNKCYTPLTGESPSWTTIDLAADRDFQLGPVTLGVILQAFNITNAKRYSNFQDFNPPEGNPHLGEGTVIVGGSQRRYQFGLRVGF